MSIVVVGIDLAQGRLCAARHKRTRQARVQSPARAKLAEVMATLPPCKLIVPKFVTPYRLSGERTKNDAADAAPAVPTL